MIYRTRIVSVGPEASSFLEEKLAITFAGNAPEELRDYCFLIEEAEMHGTLAVGQGVQIADQQWTITALGSLAENNLANLGHVTLVFDCASEPRMDGALHLGGHAERPAPAARLWPPSSDGGHSRRCTTVRAAAVRVRARAAPCRTPGAAGGSPRAPRRCAAPGACPSGSAGASRWGSPASRR